ncbi:transcriptional regulator [Clostridiaceae bacterium UIB06]|nr:transcriptional regulator [Clostridiaceae bacterium UIB06]
MEDRKISEKQQNILDIIQEYINQFGYSPTVRELCNLTKLKSSSTMQGYLDRLEHNGYITKEKGSPRTIRVLKKSS